MPINTQNTFIELVNSYHENPERFTFFIGAGLSQPLFPSWKSLLLCFYEQSRGLDLRHDENEILNLIDNGESYLDVAEVLIDAIGSTRYRDTMERVFDKEFSESEIPESYKALINLSPKRIVTTNYDRIPEVAGKGKYRINTNKNAPEASRFFANDKNTVFKMHGDIVDHSSLVITSSDYQRIIYDNSSTRLLLNSLLSTKILIFVGFSLSDPHINVILENIKSVNSGIPLSHYILLNEASSFKISSFERRYGIKVISYTPSDNRHTEVTEFLKALDSKVEVGSQQTNNDADIEITDSFDLVNHIYYLSENIFSDSAFSIFYFEYEIYLSFTPSGETQSEVQKELISIIRLFNFNCSIVNNLNISAIAKTSPFANFEDSQKILIKASLSFEDAKTFATRKSSISELWKSISFYSSSGLSSVLQRESSTTFPMSTGIIGD